VPSDTEISVAGMAMMKELRSARCQSWELKKSS